MLLRYLKHNVNSYNSRLISNNSASVDKDIPNTAFFIAFKSVAQDRAVGRPTISGPNLTQTQKYKSESKKMILKPKPDLKNPER